MNKVVKIVKMSDSTVDTFCTLTGIKFPGKPQYCEIWENGDKVWMEESHLQAYYGMSFDEIYGVLKVTID